MSEKCKTPKEQCIAHWRAMRRGQCPRDTLMLDIGNATGRTPIYSISCIVSVETRRIDSNVFV